jgi:hypothetical protein
MVSTNDPRFPLGRVVATPGALEALRDSGQTPIEFLNRHAALDPGELNAEDQQANEEAVIKGERVFRE